MGPCQKQGDLEPSLPIKGASDPCAAQPSRLTHGLARRKEMADGEGGGGVPLLG